MAGQLQSETGMAGKHWLDELMSSAEATSRPVWPAWHHARLTPWPTALTEPARQPEELFAELDGATLTFAGHTWHVAVFSIVDDEGGRWLQIGLDGPRQELATLQIPPGRGATHVNLALHTWFYEQGIGKVA
jgi:hypothetical protein